MSDSEIIRLIKKREHTQAIECLYKNYPAFKAAFNKAGGRSYCAADIYQEALYIFIQKASKDDFVLSCSINTYLFGVCKNLSYDYFRNKNKEVTLEFDSDDEPFESDSIDSLIEDERKYNALDKALIKIGAKCLEILSMFYYQNLPMTVIAEKLGFRSENSAKTQKYKCIEKARSLTINVLSERRTEMI